MQKIGRRLDPRAFAGERHLIRALDALGGVIETVGANLEFVVQTFEEVRRLELLLELVGSRSLPVIFDLNALRVVDDNSEIALLRQNSRNGQNRSKNDEREYRK